MKGNIKRENNLLFLVTQLPAIAVITLPFSMGLTALSVLSSFQTVSLVIVPPVLLVEISTNSIMEQTVSFVEMFGQIALLATEMSVSIAQLPSFSTVTHQIASYAKIYGPTVHPATVQHV